MHKLRLKRMSLRFTLWYSVLVLIFFACIIFAFSKGFGQQVLTEKGNVMEQRVELIGSYIDASIAETRAVHTQINSNHILREALEDIAASPITHESYIPAISTVTRNIRDENSSKYKAILLMDSGGQVLDSLYRQSAYRAYFDDQNAALQEFVSSNSYSMFSAPNAFPFVMGGDNATLTYYGAYYRKPDFLRIGSVIIHVNRNRFFENVKMLCASGFDLFLVADQNMNIIFQNGTALPAQQVIALANQPSFEFEGKRYHLYTASIASYPYWQMIGMVNDGMLSNEVTNMSNILMAVSGFAVLCIAFISFLITRGITDPIRRLNRAMGEMEKGQWPKLMEVTTADEMGGLVRGFNNMAGAVRTLTQDIVNEQEKKQEIELKMLKTRLELLQNQINPHFIHNTLNTMNYMATMAGNTELSGIIESFNMLLRMSISTNVDFVPLQADFACVQSYMNIQQHRYDPELIEFSLHMDEEIAGAMVPRLILQPLVENALFHGILPTGKPGRISVMCLLQDKEWVMLSVADNGAGISPDKLAAILANDLPNPKGYNSIGMKNVKERLELYYAKNCTFKVASQLGMGTIIEILLPYTSEGRTQV